MQKELKLIDRELKNNGLCRIADTTHRSEHSLFRALGMAVFLAHGHSDEVIREVRLTLVDNLKDKRQSAYPLIHESNILLKYQQQNQLLLDYWQAPDLNCFHRDNLVSASAAFAKTICIYSMDREEYLVEAYVAASKNAHQQRVRLAKVGKKYYAVLKVSTIDMVTCMREWITEELLQRLFKEDPRQPAKTEQKQLTQPQREDRIHYPNYDEVVTGSNARRKHKKSLSDCAELPQQAQLFGQAKEEAQTPPLTSVASSRTPASRGNLLDFLQQDVLDGGKVQQGYSLDGYTGENANGFGEGVNYYHNYSYPYALGQENQQYPFIEQQAQASPVNNERYTGRLKFFDQNGNYGFLVIDSLNTDLFVHYDDLSKAGLNKETLLSIKNNYQLRFSFTYYEYEGKQHKKSKKAVDLTLMLAE